MKFNVVKEKQEKYTSKKYDTPIMIGIKWQMDVKFVPKTRDVGSDNEKFHQYTVIDEASRKRFIYPYKEHYSYSTIDFVKRAIIYFNYKPQILHKDNDAEFTHITNTKRKND